jgi:hypothetical protein
VKRLAQTALGILGVLLWASDAAERFASRQRIRTGASHPRSQAWRYFAFYIRNRSRNTLDEEFATGENIFNFQVRRVW